MRNAGFTAVGGMMRYAVIAATLLCGACQYIPGSTAQIAQQVRTRMATTLNDPASAQYADLARSSDGTLVCGRINAKNRMGGYTGFEGFVFETTGDQHLWFESSEWPTGGYSRTMHKAYMERVSRCTGNPIDPAQVAADAESENLSSMADRMEAIERNMR